MLLGLMAIPYKPAQNTYSWINLKTLSGSPMVIIRRQSDRSSREDGIRASLNFHEFVSNP